MSKIRTFGADPEQFGFHIDSGRIGSFAGRLGCDKHNKKVVSDDIRLQEDNVLIEFDINPQPTFDLFSDNIQRGLDAAYQAANSVGMSIAEGISSHIFNPAELATFHERALEFGCEPDYNALTGMTNPKPAATDPGLRTAGGHIHMGYEGVSSENQKILGVMCDYFLGMPAILLDKDDRRKELYGKAGACRFKEYGIEYRVLSNFWIFKPQMRQWAFDQANKALDFALGDFMILASMVDPAEIQRVINDNDKAMAEQYIKLMEIQ